MLKALPLRARLYACCKRACYSTFVEMIAFLPMRYLIAPVALLLGLAIGYVAFSPEVAPEGTTPPPADTYEGWLAITSGGVVSMRIPPGCITDAGAGTMYVLCPEQGETPVMTVSSDGITVSIRRWEEGVWEYWDQVVASIEVVTPLAHDLTINIQK